MGVDLYTSKYGTSDIAGTVQIGFVQFKCTRSLFSTNTRRKGKHFTLTNSLEESGLDNI